VKKDELKTAPRKEGVRLEISVRTLFLLGRESN